MHATFHDSKATSNNEDKESNYMYYNRTERKKTCGIDNQHNPEATLGWLQVG